MHTVTTKQDRLRRGDAGMQSGDQQDRQRADVRQAKVRSKDLLSTAVPIAMAPQNGVLSTAVPIATAPQNGVLSTGV